MRVIYGSNQYSSILTICKKRGRKAKGKKSERTRERKTSIYLFLVFFLDCHWTELPQVFRMLIYRICRVNLIFVDINIQSISSRLFPTDAFKNNLLFSMIYIFMVKLILSDFFVTFQLYVRNRQVFIKENDKISSLVSSWLIIIMDLSMYILFTIW